MFVLLPWLNVLFCVFWFCRGISLPVQLYSTDVSFVFFLPDTNFKSCAIAFISIRVSGQFVTLYNIKRKSTAIFLLTQSVMNECVNITWLEIYPEAREILRGREDASVCRSKFKLWMKLRGSLASQGLVTDTTKTFVTAAVRFVRKWCLTRKSRAFGHQSEITESWTIYGVLPVTFRKFEKRIETDCNFVWYWNYKSRRDNRSNCTL